MGVTHDGEAVLLVHGAQHGQGQLAEELEAAPERGHGVVQPAAAQLQLGAVQQEHGGLLLELENGETGGRGSLGKKNKFVDTRLTAGRA